VFNSLKSSIPPYLLGLTTPFVQPKQGLKQTVYLSQDTFTSTNQLRSGNSVVSEPCVSKTIEGAVTALTSTLFSKNLGSQWIVRAFEPFNFTPIAHENLRIWNADIIETPTNYRGGYFKGFSKKGQLFSEIRHPLAEGIQLTSTVVSKPQSRELDSFTLKSKKATVVKTLTLTPQDFETGGFLGVQSQIKSFLSSIPNTHQPKEEQQLLLALDYITHALDLKATHQTAYLLAAMTNPNAHVPITK
jgi:hypothetical protein